MLLQNNRINNGVTNGLVTPCKTASFFKKKKASKAALYGKARKATGFKSLRVNCLEINQVTSKCQQVFE